MRGVKERESEREANVGRRRTSDGGNGTEQQNIRPAGNSQIFQTEMQNDAYQIGRPN